MDFFRYLPLEKYLHDQKSGELVDFISLDFLTSHINVLEQSAVFQKESLSKKFQNLEKLKAEVLLPNFGKNKIQNSRKVIRKAKEFLIKNAKVKKQLEEKNKTIQENLKVKKYPKEMEYPLRLLSSQLKAYIETIESRKKELDNKIDSEEREVVRLKKMSEEEQKADLESKIHVMEDFLVREEEGIKKTREEIRNFKTLKDTVIKEIF